MFDAGMVKICELVNTAAAGSMPKMALSPVASRYYEDRTVGYNRYYAAKGVNEEISLLIRVWRCREARVGMCAVLSSSENDGTYRITNVQNLTNGDGLKVTDLTLGKLEEKYDTTG